MKFKNLENGNIFETKNEYMARNYRLFSSKFEEIKDNEIKKPKVEEIQTESKIVIEEPKTEKNKKIK